MPHVKTSRASWWCLQKAMYQLLPASCRLGTACTGVVRKNSGRSTDRWLQNASGHVKELSQLLCGAWPERARSMDPGLPAAGAMLPRSLPAKLGGRQTDEFIPFWPGMLDCPSRSRSRPCWLMVSNLLLLASAWSAGLSSRKDPQVGHLSAARQLGPWTRTWISASSTVCS
jgi:hypothetical protein